MNRGAELPEALTAVIESYFSPDGLGMVPKLRARLAQDDPPPWVREFRDQWADVRSRRWLTPADWKYLTGEEFTTLDGLYQWIEELSDQLGLD